MKKIVKMVFVLALVLTSITIVYAMIATDSDRGFNPFVVGSCSENSSYGANTSVKDYCLDNSTIMEYFINASGMCDVHAFNCSIVNKTCTTFIGGARCV